MAWLARIPSSTSHRSGHLSSSRRSLCPGWMLPAGFQSHSWLVYCSPWCFESRYWEKGNFVWGYKLTSYNSETNNEPLSTEAMKTLESNLRVPWRMSEFEDSHIIQVDDFVAKLFSLNQAARLLKLEETITLVPSLITASFLKFCPNLSMGAFGTPHKGTKFL